jgi:hypothetical protein
MKKNKIKNDLQFEKICFLYSPFLASLLALHVKDDL